jgi:V/A-type H+-transporting ATPase subunit E
MTSRSELIAILEREAAAEIERVLSDARAEAERVLQEARQQAEAELAAARARLQAERATAEMRARSAAALRASALILQAKDQALAEVFGRARAELDRLTQDRARYGALLAGLVREAAAAMGGRVVVQVHPRDVDQARRAIRDLGLDAEVQPAQDVTGGVRVVAADGRFVVENTLASRLERARAALAPEIAAVLWGA